MPKTIIKIRTWSCSCGYKQDFPPTQENQDIHFNNDRTFRLDDVKENECPSCGLRGIRGKQMVKEIDLDKKTIITIMGEEDIEPEIAQEDEKRAKENKPLKTTAEKTAYREKRKADIAEAIKQARLLED